MTDVLVAVFAFFGAAAGSVLPYLASRASTRQEGAQGRREEWGRRFTAALEALTGDAEQRAVGRALLAELMRSDLATEDDRHAALAVVTATATYDPTHRADLRAVVPRDEVDDAGVVEDTGDTNAGADDDQDDSRNA